MKLSKIFLFCKQRSWRQGNGMYLLQLRKSYDKERITRMSSLPNTTGGFMNLEWALNLNKGFQFMFLQSTFGEDGLFSSKRHFSYTSVPRQLLPTPASLCKTQLSHLWPNPHCCNSRGKGDCKSFNKSQWNKGPLWQTLLLLNICQTIIS